MITNPYLAGKIDQAMIDKKITENEANILHNARMKEIPLCLGKYDYHVQDCQKQDINICMLCKKIN